MDAIDFILSGSLVLTFLVGTLINRDLWWTVETTAMVVFSVIIMCFPNALLSYMMHVTDEYRTQSVATVLLGMYITQYYTRNSPDKSIKHHVPLAKIVAGFFLLYTMHRGRLDHPELFKPAHTTFGMLGVGLWVLGNLIFLFRREFFGTGCWVLNDRLTKHMIIEVLVPMSSTVIILVHTEEAIKYFTGTVYEITPATYYLDKMLGCINIAYIFLAVGSVGFARDEDKRTYLFAKLMVFLVWFPTLVYWTGFPPLNRSLGSVLAVLNYIIGIWYRPENKAKLQ